MDPRTQQRIREIMAEHRCDWHEAASIAARHAAARRKARRKIKTQAPKPDRHYWWQDY